MPKISEERQAERREHVLSAAETCFARSGFHGTTIQAICKEAGISAGALYVYFRSKEDLIRGLTARERTEVLASIEEAGEVPDIREALRHLVVETLIDKPREKSVIFMEMGAEATRNPALADVIAECDGQIRHSLTALLEGAAAAGHIHPVMPLARIVDMMLTIGNGMMWRRAVHPGADLHMLSENLLAAIEPILGVKQPRAKQTRFPEPVDSHS